MITKMYKERQEMLYKRLMNARHDKTRAENKIKDTIKEMMELKEQHGDKPREYVFTSCYKSTIYLKTLAKDRDEANKKFQFLHTKLYTFIKDGIDIAFRKDEVSRIEVDKIPSVDYVTGWARK